MKICGEFPINYVEWEGVNQMYIINITKCDDASCYCKINQLNAHICFYPETKKYLFCLDSLGTPIIEEWITDISEKMKATIAAAINKLDASGSHLSRKEDEK